MINDLPEVELYPHLYQEVQTVNRAHGTAGTEAALAYIADHAHFYRGTKTWVDFRSFLDDSMAVLRKHNG